MKYNFLVIALLMLQNTSNPIFFQKGRDLSVNHTLAIMDDKSILKSVGSLYKYTIEDLNDGEVVFILNNDKSEYLKLMRLPGGGKNTYNEFEVSYNTSRKGLCYNSNFSYFFTESGVKLGITDSALMIIKGNPSKRSKQLNGVELYEYTSKNDLYTFRAWIKNNMVLKFRFGFVNP